MIEVIRPDWPAPAHVRALVTTRQGGVSSGPYAGLNLSLSGGDAREAVLENRRRLAGLLPAPPRWLSQVHGTTCVDAARVSDVTEADAAMTTRPGVVCAVLTADCLPVLLCAADGSAVAVAHAGWRGLRAGVIERTIDALRAAGAGELLAWYGPAIGPAAFEVGAEVRDAFVAEDATATVAFVPRGGDKFLADIYALADLRLARRGVRRATTTVVCTHTDAARFYSYRRDGVTGRMATCIWIDEPPTPRPPPLGRG